MARSSHDWTHNNLQWLTFPAHGTSVLTCMLFSHNNIIKACDDHEIHVYSPTTGECCLALKGQEGSVWAVAVSPDSPNMLVSGPTDTTVRIWDLSTGKCHIFDGYTSTIRCLTIVTPTWAEVDGQKDQWPKCSLLVTGSRDKMLQVWN
jgi:F-box and WD-40 domain protein CDC4